MPQPPERENKALTWPDWPLKLRTSSSQEEGCERDFAVATKRVRRRGRRASPAWNASASSGCGRRTAGCRCARSRAANSRSRPTWSCWPWASSGPRRRAWSEQAGVELDPRGNVKANVADYQTSRRSIFACGDMRRGQSLVVWAIREGRQCARAVDEFLMGASKLPR